MGTHVYRRLGAIDIGECIVILIILGATSSTIYASAYSTAVLSDNPVAYYRLEETTGTVATNSSTAGASLDGSYINYGSGVGVANIGEDGPRPGNPTGTSFISGFEVDNRALHSDVNPTAPVSNPRVEVPYVVGSPLNFTGALTAEAWIYRDPQDATYNTNSEGIVDRFSSAGSNRAWEFVYRVSDNTLRLILSTTGVSESQYDFGTAANLVPLGQWTHVAATFVPSTRMAIFVNGVMVAERTTVSGIPSGTYSSSVSPLWIGNQLGTTNPLTAFEGKIDEVAVYDTALSDARILAHYQAAAPPPIPGDFDSDGDVDGADFVAWQTHFPKAADASLAEGDADGDHDVDGADFVVWQTHFPYPSGAGTSPVPEPAAISLAIFAITGLAFRHCHFRTRQTSSS